MTDIPETDPAPPRALRVTLLLATIYAGLTAILTVITVAEDLFAQTVQVDLPVNTFWERLNPTLHLTGTTATVAGGGYDHATLDFTGLGVAARAWLASGHLFEGVTSVVIAVTIALLCNRVLGGNPFATLVPRAITTSGVVVLAGGLLWQACFQFGQWAVIDEAFGATGANWTNTVSGITPNSLLWPKPDGNFDIEFWPVGIAFALFALAVVFRYGQRIERDRALLARERGALAKELEGLV